MKKILSLFLAFALIFCMIPFGVLAEEATDISSYLTFSNWNNNSGYTIVKCDTSLSGDITIPSEHNGKPVLAIKGGAFDSCNSLTSVTIPDTVTEITGSSPFRFCEALTTINIPASLTSIEGSIAMVCGALTEINIDSDNPSYCSVDGVMFNKDITELLFYPGHKADLSYTIPDTVITIGKNAFEDSNVLTELIIPDSVTTISDYAFRTYYTSIERALEKITIGSGVKTIGKDAFRSCNKITQVNITDIAAWCNIDFATSSSNPMWDDAIHIQAEKDIYLNGEIITDLVIPNTVTEIKPWRFSNCRSIKSVTIPGSVTSIGEYAFIACTGLETVNFSKGLINIGDQAFSTCRVLTSVVIPDGVTTIGSGVFENCYALTSVAIPESVTSLGVNVFYGCNSLTAITIPESITEIPHYAFAYCSLLKEITIPTSVTYIGNAAFLSTALSEVTIPNSVTSIGSSAFSGTKLETVTIPGSVTSIGSYAFNACYYLADITIPDSITSISEHAFGLCTSLTEIAIPESVTSIGKGAFYMCRLLSEITIPDSVTSIGDEAFAACDSLVTIDLPQNITSINSKVFQSCHSLKEIKIPESVTSIGQYAFSGAGLETVTIPDGVTTIGQYAFANTKITELVIPAALTSITQYTFTGCTALERVYIPKAVTAINAKAFYNCTGIKSVYYEGTAEEWAAINFTTGNECLTGAVIYFNCRSMPVEITVTQLPEKTEYTEKTEELDLTGGILTVYYKNGEAEELDLTAVTVTGFDNTVLGEQTLTVEHLGLSAEFTVTVTYRPTALIAVSKLPDKLKYNYGEALDLTGGEIVVCYPDGTYETKEITKDMISGLGFEVGFKTITVSYNGVDTHFSIFMYRNADLDHNGNVSATDIAILRKSVIASDEDEELDLNVDGSLDVLDLVYIKKAAS